MSKEHGDLWFRRFIHLDERLLLASEIFVGQFLRRVDAAFARMAISPMDQGTPDAF